MLSNLVAEPHANPNAHTDPKVNRVKFVQLLSMLPQVLHIGMHAATRYVAIRSPGCVPPLALFAQTDWGMARGGWWAWSVSCGWWPVRRTCARRGQLRRSESTAERGEHDCSDGNTGHRAQSFGPRERCLVKLGPPSVTLQLYK